MNKTLSFLYVALLVAVSIMHFTAERSMPEEMRKPPSETVGYISVVDEENRYIAIDGDDKHTHILVSVVDMGYHKSTLEKYQKNSVKVKIKHYSFVGSDQKGASIAFSYKIIVGIEEIPL